MTTSPDRRSGLPRVALPANLKDRVLHAARAAALAKTPITTSPAAHWSPWDLAWAASFVLLIVAHVGLSLSHCGLDRAAQARRASSVRSTPSRSDDLGMGVAANGSHRPSEADRAQMREVLREI